MRGRSLVIGVVVLGLAVGVLVWWSLQERRVSPFVHGAGIVLSTHDGGTATGTVSIDEKSPLYEQISRYLGDSATLDGRFDLNSHAPSVELRSDLVTINFTGNNVVVSSRRSPRDVWRQVTRTASARDVEIKNLLIRAIRDHE